MNQFSDDSNFSTIINSINKKKNINLSYLDEIPLVVPKTPLKKKKLVKKYKKISFSQFFLIFILFCILNSRSLLIWINSFNISYTFSIILRALFLIIVVNYFNY